MTKNLNNFPDELIDPLRQFSKAWASSELRPRPDNIVLTHWKELISSWAVTDDLPIFIRKSTLGRGKSVHHLSGRILVPVDNSPAQWVYSLALSGYQPTLTEIRAYLKDDQIPIAMILKNEEKKYAMLRCTLSAKYNVNKLGWKLAHIEGVGLNVRTPIEAQPIDTLINHFIRLMLPANMFLIPLELSGLGEIPIMIEEMKKSQN